MRRVRTAFTLFPFVLVATLAVGLAVAGRLSTHDAVIAGSAAPTQTALAVLPTASVAPSPAASASAAPTATPTPSPSSSSLANDATEMLRVHNELRSAVGAPAVRADERVTIAAQRHAEYLARNDALGHDETPGAPGFSGVFVRDRLAAQGYTDTTASEVATSFSTGTEGVRSLWVLPYHRLGLMHPHAIVAGWGHAEISGRRITVGVIVYDFSAPAPDRVRAPAPAQRVAGILERARGRPAKRAADPGRRTGLRVSRRAAALRAGLRRDHPGESPGARRALPRPARPHRRGRGSGGGVGVRVRAVTAA